MEVLLTALLLIAAIILLFLIICHLLGNSSDKWLKISNSASTRGEKIRLANTQLFNTNGYLIQSNSEILLGSRGSFKRFESVDSAAAANQQEGYTSGVFPSSTWDNRIPPMPSRSPPKPPTKLCFTEQKMQRSTSMKAPVTAPMSLNSAIPRPSPKKQLSVPISTNIPPLTPPISTGKKRSPVTKQFTNPFLNNEECALELPRSGKNPFIDDQDQVFSFDPDRINTCIEDTQDPLRQVEARISKLESMRQFRANLKEEVLLSNEHSYNALPISVSNSSFKIESLDTKTKTELLHHIREMSSSLDSTIADLTNNLKCLDSVTVEASSRGLVTRDNHSTLNRTVSESQLNSALTEYSNDSPKKFEQSQFHSTNNNPFHSFTFVGTESQCLLDLSLNMNLESSTSSLHSMTRSGKNYNLAQYDESDIGVTTGKVIIPSSNSRVLVRQNSFGKPGTDTTNTIGCDTNICNLKRAISCDSVSSESSVVLGDLEQIAPPITGSICVGLQFDK